MTALRKERAYEKYAWIIPFAFGIFVLLFSIALFIAPSILEYRSNRIPPNSAVESLTGRTLAQITTSDPGFANYSYYLIRTLSIFFSFFSVYIAVVSATTYRRGERWAWYVTWLLPAILVIDSPYEYFAVGFIDYANLPFFAILVVGLLLPYRKFFPRRQPGLL